MYNAGPHCKLVCITKCAIHPVEIKDIIIIYYIQLYHSQVIRGHKNGFCSNINFYHSLVPVQIVLVPVDNSLVPVSIILVPVYNSLVPVGIILVFISFFPYKVSPETEVIQDKVLFFLDQNFNVFMKKITCTLNY
jgi:hypothetical protein